jgi:hypothetical protein
MVAHWIRQAEAEEQRAREQRHTKQQHQTGHRSVRLIGRGQTWTEIFALITPRRHCWNDAGSFRAQFSDW